MGAINFGIKFKPIFAIASAPVAGGQWDHWPTQQVGLAGGALTSGHAHGECIAKDKECIAKGYCLQNPEVVNKQNKIIPNLKYV